MEHLSDKPGLEVKDFGAAAGEVVLYPDVARAVAEAVPAVWGNAPGAFWTQGLPAAI